MRGTMSLGVCLWIGSIQATAGGEAEAAAGAQAATAPAAGWTSYKPSDPLNRQLPRWLKLSGEARLRFEGRTAFGYKPGDDDYYGLSRLRINVDLRPAHWVQLFAQGQDSRVVRMDTRRVGPLFKDTLDVRQAYLYLGNTESWPAAVRLGRQDLLFGAQRLVGPLDWTNTARSFDALRLELVGKKARADIFAASVVRLDPTVFDKRRDGENFHGIYSAFTSLLPLTVIEPYLFFKTNPRVLGERRASGSLGRYTAGYRIASRPGVKQLHGLDYSAEFARQWGHLASDEISAWAGYGILGYTAGRLPWSPRFNAEYSYATGDPNPGDGSAGTFDNLYPTNHLFYGLADLIGWQNIRNPRVGIDVKPHKKMKVSFDHHWFALADRHDHLYAAGLGIGVRTPAGGARHTDIGRELDAAWWYTVSPQWIFGAGCGRLFPGKYLKENSPGSSTTFPYVFMTYRM